ncbi:uncharacterized protein LOC120328413 [Styela clava]
MKLPVLFLVSVVLLLSHNSSAKQIRRHIYGPLKDGEYCQKDYFEIAKGWLEERYCKKCRRGYENNDTEHSNTCTKIKTKPSIRSPPIRKKITEEHKPNKEENRNVSNLTATPTMYEPTKSILSPTNKQTTTPIGVNHGIKTPKFREKNKIKNNETSSTKEIDTVCKPEASNVTAYICIIAILSVVDVAAFAIIAWMCWRSNT